MIHLGQQPSKHRSIIFNSITLILIVAIAFLLKKESTEIAQTNKQHAALLMNVKQKYLNLESQFVNNTSKFGEFDKMLITTIASEQLKIQKMLKLIQQKIKVKLQKPEYDRSLVELSYEQRLNRLEKYIADHHILIDLIENQIKESIKDERAKKFKELASKNNYFTNTIRKNYWLMEQANLRTSFTNSYDLKKMQQLFQKQQGRLQQTYHLSRYNTELPFCIIVPSYNNAKNFRYEFNLQSILNQQYQNYHVIIVDDASSDHTGYLIQRFLKKNNISDKRVKVVINQKRLTAVPNIHYAIMNHCNSEDIGFFVDGDDQLISRKVFQIYNSVYQSKRPAIAYSIALQYWIMDDLVKDGWSMPYTDQQKTYNRYREVPQKISHLRSFRIDLYQEIKQKDLKDQNGQWFTSTYDQVICLPMLEMSCGNIEFINQYLYLYSYGTGLNDRQVDQKLQYNIAQYVKFKMPKYQCNRKFGNPLPKPILKDSREEVKDEIKDPREGKVNEKKMNKDATGTEVIKNKLIPQKTIEKKIGT